ncbi:MAG: protein kinase [Acidobacteria bacterium]|nr:protein kinase [Acidobacteriota bacterium]
MSLPPGARLGPYEIVAKIGAGGMGEVFRARDSRLGRDVAIKVLPADVSARPDRLRRFAQEARAAAALSHPNVLAVYDVHVEGESPYVVSELLEGETLRDALQRGPLPARRAVDIAVQVASGLAAAHQKGIVHRDVKPANIFLTADGRAKVLDFGLARIVEPGDTDAVTTLIGQEPATLPGTVLGTVGYMAPEQVRGEVVDARADVFSLGTVCYEMLAGRRAFTGDTSVEIMAAIIRSDPPDLPPETPPGLSRIVRRCLEKLPAQRFQSAADVAFALDAVAGGTAPSVSASVAAAPPPTPPAARAGPGVAAAVAAAFLVGGGLVWAALRMFTPAPVAEVVYEAKTFDRLPVMNARFMPDGQTIVYSAASRGYAPALYVISPTAEAPQRLDVPDAHLLSVSAKGELALIVNARYLQQRLYAGTLARMTLGSSPRAVLDGVREADWGPDGESLAVVHDLGNGRDRLEYPIGTARHEATGYLSDPRVSPDGKSVAFVAHAWRFDDRGTVMVVGADGAAHALTPELWSIEGLAWTRDGGTLVFSGNATGGGQMQPMAVAADGRTPHRTVLSAPARLIVHDVAADGRWLAVREDLTFGVRARVPGVAAERDLSWLGSSGARSLSADGRQLLMVDVGQRSGPSYGVVLRATDGSQPMRLGAGSAERLSPDGRWAAAIVASPPEVVLYPTGPGTPRRLGAGRFDPVSSVQWFPDGQHLLVCGTETGRLPRCYRTDLDGTAFTPITEDGVRASLAPDGVTLLLTMADGSARAGRLGDTATRVVPAIEGGDRVVGWSRDSAAVFVQHGFEVPVEIARVDLATGARTTAGSIAPEGIGAPASVLVADWLDEGRAYAYNYTSVPSVLFVVNGARP